MKESVSLTTIFQIVILFILLFAGIMTLTINNSNAFGVKDEIGNIIQLTEGDFLESENGELKLSNDIVNVISETSYRTIGTCESGFTGFTKTGELDKSPKRNNSAICIKCVSTTSGFDEYITERLTSGELVSNGGFLTGEELQAYYYEITVFYQLDIPVLKQVYDFKTKGETKIMYGSDTRLCR